jgi:hypothetical protein
MSLLSGLHKIGHVTTYFLGLDHHHSPMSHLFTFGEKMVQPPKLMNWCIDVLKNWWIDGLINWLQQPLNFGNWGWYLRRKDAAFLLNLTFLQNRHFVTGYLAKKSRFRSTVAFCFVERRLSTLCLSIPERGFLFFYHLESSKNKEPLMYWHEEMMYSPSHAFVYSRILNSCIHWCVGELIRAWRIELLMYWEIWKWVVRLKARVKRDRHSKIRPFSAARHWRN